MTVVGLLLTILIAGVLIWAAFWLIDLIAAQLPAGAGKILKVIVAIIALILVIGAFTGQTPLPRLY